MVRSDQDKFKTQEPEDFFANMVKIYTDIDEEKEPPYSKDSRARDKWLIEFARREPHLSGILSSVTAIDKNRGWSLIGSMRQVNKYARILHNFRVSPGLKGWRPAFAQLSASFWGTNLGAVVEVGRVGVDGPVQEFYTADPTKFVLAKDQKFPIYYYPSNGKRMKWRDSDFFRICSLPSILEENMGIGFCAVDRAVQLARLMLALFRHDEEMLLSRAPRGLLLLSGIKRDQWESAMKARDAELDQGQMKYFGAIAVLASASSTVEAKLMALSQLPAGFDLKIWMDMIMYGYSLCFGYDASEFWPVQYGSLGRGNETQIQHEKATGKGRLDFVLGFQEQVTDFLPESLDFVVEQRDDQGDLTRASVIQAWANVAKSLYTSQLNGIPLVTNEEARVLLAEYGVIPATWSPTADASATDIDDADDEEVVDQPEDEESAGGSSEGNMKPKSTSPDSASPTAEMLRSAYKTRRIQDLREVVLQKASVFEAARRFPKEPIVQFTYPGNNILELWKSGEDLMKPRVWASIGDVVRRAIQESLPPAVVGSGLVQSNQPTQPQIVVVDTEGRIVQQARQEPSIVVNVPEQNFQVDLERLGEVIAKQLKQASDPTITLTPIIQLPEIPVIVENNVTIQEPVTEAVVEVNRGFDGKIKSVKKTEKVIR